MDVTVVETDEDYEAFRQVRIAVYPHERCPSVQELEDSRRPDQLLLLAQVGGEVVAHGLAQRSDVADRAAAAPRVLPEHRRRGYGSELLEVLLDHVRTLDVPAVQTSTDDDGSLAFALRHGFEPIDHQVEQLRAIGDEPDPGGPPEGIAVVTTAERPELWAACHEYFGREVLADFALTGPLDVDLEQWTTDWTADPMWLALDGDRVVGCAGLLLDEDTPDRAEHALTAVARSHRGRGIAVHLKERTLHWAAQHGLREVYTWTQDGNARMRTLNERLGYRNGLVSTTLSRDLR